MKSFLSDNTSGVHSKIMNALIEANADHSIPYGNDKYSNEVTEILYDIFQTDKLSAYFVFNGTGANTVACAAGLRSYQSILTSNHGHIYDTETGAFENLSGSKIFPIQNVEGKITPYQLHKFLDDKGNIHHSQPKLISISQITEFGTAYTNSEICELCKFAHAHDMYVHIDGARLSNALVSQDTNLFEMITKNEVDIISIGGTKNGLMYGELIVCFNSDIDEHLKYFIKHGNQLASKSRFISAQFKEFFKDELYLEMAKKANDCAVHMKNLLSEIDNITVSYPVGGNVVLISTVDNIKSFIIDNGYGLPITYDGVEYIRMVTSFDTTKEEVENFITDLKNYLG